MGEHRKRHGRRRRVARSLGGEGDVLSCKHVSEVTCDLQHEAEGMEPRHDLSAPTIEIDRGLRSEQVPFEIKR